MILFISYLYLCLQFTSTVSVDEDAVDLTKRTEACDPNYLHTLEQKVSTMLIQVDDLSSKYNQQQNLITQLSTKLQQIGSGAVYVRWGRTTCGNDSELVYAGYSGGSLYSHTGAAAEYVCMPKVPDYEYTDYHDYDGYIYGAEYESNFFGTARVNDDAPCAVCRSTKRRSVLMTPGKNTCESGWNMEYHGILASGYHGHAAATQYVCLDHDMEASPHGMSNEDGKLFYRVRSKCGSLPCPPYVDGYILSCVVCSL